MEEEIISTLGMHLLFVAMLLLDRRWVSLLQGGQVVSGDRLLQLLPKQRRPLSLLLLSSA